jgi:Flp pilus assembly protein TadD
MKKEIVPDAFTATIAEATRALRRQDYEAARTRITDAITLNVDAPEPHNLLGILNELTGDDNAARRHYRAAYALDSAYRPACRNLERLAVFEWGMQKRTFDYGDGPDNGLVAHV